MRHYADLPIVFLTHFSVVAVRVARGGRGCRHRGARPRRATGQHLADRVETVAPTILALAVVAAAVYALLLAAASPGKLAARDAYALRTFANYYLTVPGLLAALLGFALVARQFFWRDPEIFTTVALFSFFFFYKIRIASDHFWMARRFLPVILPGALLFAAAAALSGTRGGWAPTRVRARHHRRRVRRPAGDAVRASGQAGPGARRVRGRHCQARRPRGQGQRPRPPRGRVAERVRHARPRAAARLHLRAQRARAELSEAGQDGCWPRFSIGRGLDTTACCSWAAAARTCCRLPGGARPIASERFQVPEYDAPADAYPRFVRQKEFDYSLYELTAPDAGAGTRGLRPRRRRQRRPARRPFLREGTERGAFVPLVTVAVARRADRDPPGQPRSRPLVERRWPAARRRTRRRDSRTRQRSPGHGSRGNRLPAVRAADSAGAGRTAEQQRPLDRADAHDVGVEAGTGAGHVRRSRARRDGRPGQREIDSP